MNFHLMVTIPHNEAVNCLILKHNTVKQLKVSWLFYCFYHLKGGHSINFNFLSIGITIIVAQDMGCQCNIPWINESI